MKRTNLIALLIVLVAIIILGILNYSPKKPIGGETDEHGCMLMAGYTWCESKQVCLRKWEEPCPETEITLKQAKEIAKSSECIEKGQLTENHIYNSNTKTWWIDLDIKKEFKKDYCNPACVINEVTKTAEINWRCTGAMP